MMVVGLAMICGGVSQILAYVSESSGQLVKNAGIWGVPQSHPKNMIL